MRPIPAEEIQPLLLGVLRAFAHYCDAHELRYFLDYGTLLGAVRHKGFISWDDDVDVSMLKDDYERFLTLARESPYLDAERRYRVLLPAELPNFYPFVKVVDESTLAYEKNIKREYALGIWLDVFCLVHCPDDAQASAQLFSQHHQYKSMNELIVCGNVVGTRRKILYPFAATAGAALRLMGRDSKYWAQHMIGLVEGAPSTGDMVGQLSWPDCFETDVFPLSWWDDVVELEFEGERFTAPHAYHEVLQKHYGDYMELPPEKDRVRHDFEAYYREERTA